MSSSNSNSNVGQSYGGGNPNGYTFTAANPVYNTVTTPVWSNGAKPVSTGGITITLSKRRCIEVEKDDIKVVIKSRSDGPIISATLDPEADLRPTELLRIMTLMQLIESDEPMEELDPIAYLRRYQLERHFRFTSE